ncbi:hypothetical protein WJX84_006535 [Apatococcus fuscideae]|uniref:Uncharacterized protein n=1 Tax=Apatococcus fuscideae TaxID=2026836 RepID=A0AAW1S8T6_9CHLO
MSNCTVGSGFYASGLSKAAASDGLFSAADGEPKPKENCWALGQHLGGGLWMVGALELAVVGNLWPKNIGYRGGLQAFLRKCGGAFLLAPGRPLFNAPSSRLGWGGRIRPSVWLACLAACWWGCHDWQLMAHPTSAHRRPPVLSGAGGCVAGRSGPHVVPSRQFGLGYYCPHCPTIKLAIINFAFTLPLCSPLVAIDIWPPPLL